MSVTHIRIEVQEEGATVFSERVRQGIDKFAILVDKKSLLGIPLVSPLLTVKRQKGRDHGGQLKALKQTFNIRGERGAKMFTRR